MSQLELWVIFPSNSVFHALGVMKQSPRELLPLNETNAFVSDHQPDSSVREALPSDPNRSSQAYS